MRAIRWLWAALLIGAWVGPALAWQAAPVMRHDNTDFPGNDLQDMIGRARSFDDCAQRCLADGRCGAFTFNLNNGNCIPKSSAGAPERNDRAVSGVLQRSAIGAIRPGPELPVTRYDATDFPQNDIGDLVTSARSFDECARRCLADGRCSAFTFNLNNGACIPKSAAGAPQRNERAVSGVVSRASEERPYPGATATISCSVEGTRRCPGCSAACSVSQQPVCSAPVESPGGFCLRAAECRCASD